HSGKPKGPTKSLRVEVRPVPEERVSAKNVLMHGMGLPRPWKSPVRSKAISRNSPVSMHLGVALVHPLGLTAVVLRVKVQPPLTTGTPLTVPQGEAVPEVGSHCVPLSSGTLIEPVAPFPFQVKI